MKKSDRQKLLLHEKNLYKAFAILATPVFFANMLKSFHDLVDTYFIGQMANSVQAQAGISSPKPTHFVGLAFGLVENSASR